MATNKATNVKHEEDIVRPITLRNTEENLEYVLEFDRESVKFAESKGFRLEDVANFPMVKIPEFFWYAFRMHHKSMSKEKAERILYEELGGVPEGLIDRLAKLYTLPFEALTKGEEKNARMTVEF